MAFPFGAIGGLIGGAIGAASARAKNKADMKRLQFKTEFDERMSSTAYQRGMADMRKAGLNPILAYKQGGASSPSAAFAPTVDVGAAGLSSAKQVMTWNQEMKNLKQQNLVLRSTHDLNDENVRAQALRNYGLVQDANFASTTGVSTAFANSLVGKATMAANFGKDIKLPDFNLGGKTSSAIQSLKQWWNTPGPRSGRPRKPK